MQTCLRLHGVSDGSVLVDCGASSLIALKRAAVDPNDVGWVLLTHLHGDHFGGIPFLVLDGQFRRRTRPLVIAGPRGVRARVEAAMEVLFPGSTGVSRAFAVDFVELQERLPIVAGSARVTAFAVEHASGAPAYALRVEYGGRVVTYSGDTQWTDALVEAAVGADLFVCEALFYDRKVRYHLDYRTLFDQRHHLRCRKIILTHMGPEMLARRAESVFPCAEDGLVVSLADE